MRPVLRAFRAGVLLAGFGIPCALHGQAAPGSIEIGAGGGRFYGGSFARGSTEAFDHKVLADDDILKGFWIGAQISRGWGVELSVRRTATHFVANGSGVFPNKPALGGLDFATIELLGIRSFRFGNVLPYAGFGIGVANLDPDLASPAIRDSNRFALSAAIGARLYAARWIGVRVDGRARATYLGSRRFEDHGFFDSGRWFRNGEILGGVFLSFGGR
jgi:hypothetical protein